MSNHLVGAFVSIPQNKHDQSGSSFRIEQKLHDHHQSGDSHIFKPSTPVMPITIYTTPKCSENVETPSFFMISPGWKSVETPNFFFMAKIPLFHNDCARGTDHAQRLDTSGWVAEWQTESTMMCCLVESSWNLTVVSGKWVRSYNAMYTDAWIANLKKISHLGIGTLTIPIKWYKSLKMQLISPYPDAISHLDENHTWIPYHKSLKHVYCI